MKNIGIVILVIGSLLGLVFIQYHLLKVGILLEKNRFEFKVKTLLEKVSYRIDENEVIRQHLTRMYTAPVENLRSPEYLLPKMLQDSLEQLFREELFQADMDFKYTYRLLELNTDNVLAETEPVGKMTPNFEVYKKQLRGRVAAECRCQPVLEFRVDHLLNYLLGQLAYLIVPSMLFIFLLLGCLFLLIFNLNKQRKLDQIKNTFINNLTHELKTPVFSISLITKVLREAIEKGRKEKATDFIQLIEKENEQLKQHIDKVLELATLESGKYELQRQSTDLHELLKEMTGQLALKVNQKRGKIIQRFEALSPILKIDPIHFRSAILNILENALKYNDKAPEITIRTDNETEYFVLSIQDNGIGISIEEQKRIFEKFYRVSQGDLHQVKGFGLGLSYVKQIVEAHGGKISVRSKPGKGTGFKISIPQT